MPSAINVDHVLAERRSGRPGPFPLPSWHLALDAVTFSQENPNRGDLETPLYLESNTSNTFSFFKSNDIELILFSYVISPKGITNLSNFKPHNIRNIM